MQWTVRQPNVHPPCSPSVSTDLDHIHELYSQELEVGFCLNYLKKDCLSSKNRRLRGKIQTTWAKTHQFAMPVYLSLADFYDTVFGKSKVKNRAKESTY